MDKTFNVSVPSMGEGVHEATLVRWLKEVGESVQKGDPLLEVSTDKVDTEILAEHSGFLIGTFAQKDQVLAVSQVIAQIATDKNIQVTYQSQDSHTNKAGASKTDPHKNHRESVSTSRNSNPQRITTEINSYHLEPKTLAGYVRSSPLVRKMAKDLGISLADVAGSGLYGRITRQDLENYLEHGASRIPRHDSDTADHAHCLGRSQLEHLKTSLSETGEELLEGVSIRREKMSKIRKLTAEHMVRSVRIAPHVTTTFEMDMTPVILHKEANASRWQAEHGVKLTYTCYMIEAVKKALKAIPQINGVVDGDDILLRDDINIGCAVATDHGLIVPVLKKVQDMDLVAIAKRLDDLVLKARNKKLEASDIKGGTFSITNPGIFGSLHSQPIINQPQSAILSVGAMIKRPVVIGDDIKIRTISQVGLTFDHRIVDGEEGAKFLAHVKRFLEEL